MKVFVLAGQSNMQGQGVVAMDDPMNAESYLLIGNALGEGMVDLLAEAGSK